MSTEQPNIPNSIEDKTTEPQEQSLQTSEDFKKSLEIDFKNRVQHLNSILIQPNNPDKNNKIIFNSCISELESAYKGAQDLFNNIDGKKQDEIIKLYLELKTTLSAFYNWMLETIPNHDKENKTFELYEESGSKTKIPKHKPTRSPNARPISPESTYEVTSGDMLSVIIPRAGGPRYNKNPDSVYQKIQQEIMQQIDITDVKKLKIGTIIDFSKINNLQNDLGKNLKKKLIKIDYPSEIETDKKPPDKNLRTEQSKETIEFPTSENIKKELITELSLEESKIKIQEGFNPNLQIILTEDSDFSKINIIPDPQKQNFRILGIWKTDKKAGRNFDIEVTNLQDLITELRTNFIELNKTAELKETERIEDLQTKIKKDLSESIFIDSRLTDLYTSQNKTTDQKQLHILVKDKLSVIIQIAKNDPSKYELIRPQQKENINYEDLKKEVIGIIKEQTKGESSAATNVNKSLNAEAPRNQSELEQPNVELPNTSSINTEKSVAPTRVEQPAKNNQNSDNSTVVESPRSNQNPELAQKIKTKQSEIIGYLSENNWQNFKSLLNAHFQNPKLKEIFYKNFDYNQFEKGFVRNTATESISKMFDSQKDLNSAWNLLSGNLAKITGINKNKILTITLQKIIQNNSAELIEIIGQEELNKIITNSKTPEASNTELADNTNIKSNQITATTPNSIRTPARKENKITTELTEPKDLETTIDSFDKDQIKKIIKDMDADNLKENFIGKLSQEVLIKAIEQNYISDQNLQNLLKKISPNTTIEEDFHNTILSIIKQKEGMLSYSMINGLLKKSANADYLKDNFLLEIPAENLKKLVQVVAELQPELLTSFIA